MVTAMGEMVLVIVKVQSIMHWIMEQQVVIISHRGC